jgi:ribulose-phosphate 3-epimerase
MEFIIAPSILAADFWDVGKAVEAAEAGGAGYIHVDVMDGHFVPNLTFGPAMVRSLKKHTRLPLDVHLMIEDAPGFVDPFAEAGADIITFHAEAVDDPPGLARRLREKGVKPSVSVKPDTPVGAIEDLLGHLDMVLVMTVHPGFSYQKMIPECVRKVTELRAKGGETLDIEVDGGINRETIAEVARAGANIVVAGSGVFGAPDVTAATRELRDRLVAEYRSPEG